MKKTILTFVMGLFTWVLFSNPLYAPPDFLAKFYFENNQNWVIIMIPYECNSFDSISISSSTSKSISKRLTLVDNINLGGSLKSGYIIRNDSLKSNVHINTEGDSISIISYLY